MSRPVREYWLFHSFEGIVGSIFVTLVLFATVFGRLLAPQGPADVDLHAVLQAPSGAHLFGTDDTGRDVLSRVLAGASYTIPTAIGVVVASMVIGIVVGVAAGYLGGWLGNALMRLTDLFLSYPSMLLAIAVVSALGAGLWQAAIALTAVVWAAYARLAQVQTAAIRDALFMDAAKMSGTSGFHKVFRHVLPNAVGPVVVKATMDVALCVEWIAGLGFVGLGAQEPAPEWGVMIATSRGFVLNAWWYVLFPCLALLVVVLGFNLLGTALDNRFYGRASLSRSALRRMRELGAGRVPPAELPAAMQVDGTVA
jgi:peptide/nickel transport system permease protein